MTGTWEVALAGTSMGIFGGWLMKITDKCKWYIIKPKNQSCCEYIDCCTSCECGIGFTKKPMKPDGDADTEIKITEINGVNLAYVNKRGNFVKDDDSMSGDEH
jgi:hypothetical protein